jgi:antirestriction protein ArdC
MHTLYRQIYRGERGETIMFVNRTDEGKCKANGKEEVKGKSGDIKYK